MKPLHLVLAAAALLLSGCATTPPIDLSGADTTLSPNEAVTDIARFERQRVAWGGAIVNTRNLKDTTEIEVLGYPLDRGGRPDADAPAQHRFLIVREGYLESADYRPGRLVTATGTIGGTRQGKVGEAPYTYPVLRADRLYLWPVGEAPRRTPNVHFGIGVGVIVR